MSSPRPTELRRQILGSAAFRLTLRFAGIFVLCLLALNVAIGLSARWAVERGLRGDATELLEELREAYDSGGTAALALALEESAAEAAEDDLALGLQAADGVALGGGLVLPAPRQGWSVVVPPGIDEDEALWVRTEPLPDGGWLSVGVSTESWHDIAELMQVAAVWTVAIALPLALLSGALLSRAVLNRLAPIAATAEGVREGELSRRAPVSERRDEFDRLAADLNAMLDTIEALTRNLRNVSVGIAHELRTPLARVRNRLVEMREAPPGPEALDAALAEIDAALTTFDALLKIGQIEADAQRRGFEIVPLSELVSELADTYEPVAAEQGKRLTAEVAPAVELRGNRALLTQMVSNLLENALEHTPAGTAIRLALSAAADGPMLVVEDDGPGIPPAESERIFDRFHRLERSRAKPGNGLGLSLVRSICSLHGFAVRLAPRPSGARFEITL